MIVVSPANVTPLPTLDTELCTVVGLSASSADEGAGAAAEPACAFDCEPAPPTDNFPNAAVSAEVAPVDVLLEGVAPAPALLADAALSVVDDCWLV